MNKVKYSVIRQGFNGFWTPNHILHHHYQKVYLLTAEILFMADMIFPAPAIKSGFAHIALLQSVVGGKGTFLP